MTDTHLSSEDAMDGTVLQAHRCPNGHLSSPGHPRCPDCGAAQTETIDLSDRSGTIVTWTTSTAPPAGIRKPNHLAIVEFDIDGDGVRVLGQLTTADVEIGDVVAPTYAGEIRDPDQSMRSPDSQAWDGYRFEPV